jgi:predicted nuclease of predicted toxin-antitoxin system
LRFLIDNSLSPLIADGLGKVGHDARHVRDYGMQKAADPIIFERARRERRTIVAADTDFGAILALRGTRKPSVILFRLATHRPEKQLALLLATLPKIEDDIANGSAITIEESRVRIRPLPIKMVRRRAR